MDYNKVEKSVLKLLESYKRKGINKFSELKFITDVKQSYRINADLAVSVLQGYKDIECSCVAYCPHCMNETTIKGTSSEIINMRFRCICGHTWNLWESNYITFYEFNLFN